MTTGSDMADLRSRALARTWQVILRWTAVSSALDGVEHPFYNLAQEAKMSKHDRITKKLVAAGACWAVSDYKYCGADDPLEDQMRGRETYHVHPDASYPHQDHIQRFTSLAEIEDWLAGDPQVDCS